MKSGNTTERLRLWFWLSREYSMRITLEQYALAKPQVHRLSQEQR